MAKQSSNGPIQSPFLLIAEGTTDTKFFALFAKHLELSDLQVEDYGGKGGLQGYLEGLQARTGFAKLNHLIIVRDADESPTSAFDSVCTALKNVNATKPIFPIPASPLTTVGDDLKVTISIIPEHEQGMLESYTYSALTDPVVIPCIENYIECLDNNGERPPNTVISKLKFRLFRLSKAKNNDEFRWADEKIYESEWMDWEADVLKPISAVLRAISIS